MRKLTPALYGALAAAAALSVAGAAIAQTADAPAAKAGAREHRAMSPSTRAEAQAHAARMFERLDANGDGQLNADDRQARVAQRFAKLDGNGDGALSLEEFSSAHEKRGEGMRGAKGDRHHRMGHGRGGMMRMMAQKADTNGDNQVSAAEFEAAALARFDAADADGNGTVTAEERKAAMQKMREGRKQARAEWRSKRAAQQPGTAD